MEKVVKNYLENAGYVATRLADVNSCDLVEE